MSLRHAMNSPSLPPTCWINLMMSHSVIQIRVSSWGVHPKPLNTCNSNLLTLNPMNPESPKALTYASPSMQRTPVCHAVSAGGVDELHKSLRDLRSYLEVQFGQQAKGICELNPVSPPLFSPLPTRSTLPRVSRNGIFFWGGGGGGGVCTDNPKCPKP